MPRPNPSHPKNWLDEEIDLLLRSVEAGEEPEPREAPTSAADRAIARWFRRPATHPDEPRVRVRRRARPRIWARLRGFVGVHRGDLGFYAAGIVASALLGWLIVLIDKP